MRKAKDLPLKYCRKFCVLKKNRVACLPRCVQNKYALLKIREVPGFSNLKYVPKQRLTFKELREANLLLGREKSFFKSSGYFERVYESIRFCVSSVETYETSSSNIVVFSEQVIVFSMFHEFKISETAIQIFSKKNKILK